MNLGEPARKRLAGALLLALLLFLTFLTLHLIMDDLWTDLAIGRQIVEQRGLPARDDMTFGENERPWMPHLWGSELAMYATYAAWGLGGVRWFFLAAAFLFLAAVAWLYRSVGLGVWGSAFGACAVFAMSLDRFRQRPVIFEMIFVYVVAAWLTTSWERLDAKRILALYALTALFVNLHSGALIAPVLVAAWAAGDWVPWLLKRTRPPALELGAAAVVAAIAGSLTTPHHVRLWVYILGPKPVLEQVPEYFSTLRYLTPAGLAEIPWSRLPVVLAPWIVVLLILVAWLIRGRSLQGFPLTLPQLLVSLPLLFLATRHLRFIYMAGVPLAFLLGSMRGVLATRRVAKGMLVAATVGLLAFVTWDRVRGAWYCATHPGEHVLVTAFPVEATRYLEQAGARKRIFSDPMWSTYLLFRLYPGSRTFYDMRNIYGGLRVVNEAAEIRSGGPRQTELIERYAIDLVVSPGPFAFTPREAARWRLVFRNSRAPYEHVYARTVRDSRRDGT